MTPESIARMLTLYERGERYVKSDAMNALHLFAQSLECETLAAALNGESKRIARRIAEGSLHEHPELKSYEIMHTSPDFPAQTTGSIPRSFIDELVGLGSIEES